MKTRFTIDEKLIRGQVAEDLLAARYLKMVSSEGTVVLWYTVMSVFWWIPRMRLFAYCRSWNR